MDLSRPSGLHLLISGLVLWLIGAVIGFLIPAFAPIGAVVILLGQILAFVGVILLIIAVIRGVL